jgi:hypothetical protein
MISPKCGKEMEEGFLSLNLPELMEWTKGKSRPETEKLESISTLRYKPGLSRDYIKSHRCENCRLVTFVY